MKYRVVKDKYKIFAQYKFLFWWLDVRIATGSVVEGVQASKLKTFATVELAEDYINEQSD